ncbi:hypothetical protein F5Y16DRAFT_37812 [Xylariaceae sp. FL0255]|nr:hypothetical protein F5Y16DRAFT_37812 [Xylariaceae sp. FL0255]
MPVVNLPTPRSHSSSIIISSLIHLPDQVPLLLTLTAAVVGPIALITLIASVRRRYITALDPVKAELRLVTTAHQHHSSKQSRETTEWRSMPPSRKAELAPHKPHRREDLYRSRHGSPPSPRRTQPELEEKGEKRRGGSDSPKNPAHVAAVAPSTRLDTMTSKIISFEDRRLSSAASINGDFDLSLTYHLSSESYSRPSSESTMATFSPSTQASSPISLRRSYSKILDPSRTSISIDAGGNVEPDGDASALAFSPSSFPSSSPILPLAPHASFEQMDEGSIDSRNTIDDVVSTADDAAVAGWHRHTRVYGGGVCLACMAKGAHGDEEGGFYGDNVPMDQRR